jgi:hypothetical protein
MLAGKLECLVPPTGSNAPAVQPETRMGGSEGAPSGWCCGRQLPVGSEPDQKPRDQAGKWQHESESSLSAAASRDSLGWLGRGSEGRPSVAGWASTECCADRERDKKTSERLRCLARVRRLRDWQQEIRTLGGIASTSTRARKVGKLPGLAPKGNLEGTQRSRGRTVQRHKCGDSRPRGAPSGPTAPCK